MSVKAGQQTPSIVATDFVAIPLITSLLLRPICTRYGWYSVRLYISRLNSAPLVAVNRVLTHTTSMRIAPASSAAQQKRS